MYELMQISEHDYYVNCPAKIGIVKIGGDDVILIDSGSDKDAGKKVLKILDGNNWKLRAVYNTHSHADHIGGNRFLQEKTGCIIYAPGLEAVFSNDPQLEPMGLYGGMPFKELKNKFLMAEKSRVLPLTEDCLPEGMKLLPLPGHSFDMVGFLTGDGNAFIADSVSSEETLAKYGIGYLWDPRASVETLEFLKTVEAANFIPAHAAVTDSIIELADLNIRSIEKITDAVLAICEKPVAFENLMKQIFDDFGMTLNVQQYVLIGSTLRSYLSSLHTRGKLTFEFADNKMLWKISG